MLCSFNFEINRFRLQVGCSAGWFSSWTLRNEASGGPAGSRGRVEVTVWCPAHARIYQAGRRCFVMGQVASRLSFLQQISCFCTGKIKATSYDAWIWQDRGTECVGERLETQDGWSLSFCTSFFWVFQNFCWKIIAYESDGSCSWSPLISIFL